jgi:hypothetical protein
MPAWSSDISMDNARAGLQLARYLPEHVTAFMHNSPLQSRLRWWLTGYPGHHGPSGHKIFSYPAILQGVRRRATRTCSLPPYPRDGDGRASKRLQVSVHLLATCINSLQCASEIVGTVNSLSHVLVDSKKFERDSVASKPCLHFYESYDCVPAVTPTRLFSPLDQLSESLT